MENSNTDVLNSVLDWMRLENKLREKQLELALDRPDRLIVKAMERDDWGALFW